MTTTRWKSHGNSSSGAVVADGDDDDDDGGTKYHSHLNISKVLYFVPSLYVSIFSTYLLVLGLSTPLSPRLSLPRGLAMPLV